MLNNMKKIDTKNNKGFTLLETLVAIFIMTIAFTALLSMMSTSMFSARYANNEITATYLAQEAIDYIRNDRDTTAFQGGNWVQFLNHYGSTLSSTNCFSARDACTIEVAEPDPTIAVIPCLSMLRKCSVPLLYEEDTATSGRFYTYASSSTAVPTNFRRTVNMELGNIVNGIPEELDITVTIDWFNGSVARSQKLKASLLKWQK